MKKETTMPKSERQRQKKADAKKRRERERRIKQAKNAQQQKTLSDLRQNASALKQLLSMRGYKQNFYDFLDSYVDAFHKEVLKAESAYASILGIHEVEDQDYYAPSHDALFARLGHSGLRQLFVSLTDAGDDYTAHDRRSNVNGTTTAFHDEAGQLKTLVLIRKTIPNVHGTEARYAFKLIALFHEIGHVNDWENGIHLHEGDIAVLDAEVYAHKWTLRSLMDGDYRAALGVYLDALEKLQTATDYRKTIADELVSADLFRQCQACARTNWSDHLDADSASAEELRTLARHGFRL